MMFLALACARGNDLEAGFRQPPQASGSRCFWWWLNGNVTDEAITRDLEEMKAKGFSGALIFDADGSGQRGNERVPAGPTFGSPEWTGLFVHACREADRLGLELSLNIQSGWNLGGPKVSEEDSSQHLVWSKTLVEGPAKLERKLGHPGSGFFRDVVVLAVPASDPVEEGVRISASSAQKSYPANRAMDGDGETFWVSEGAPSPEKPQWLELRFRDPKEISEVQIDGRPGYGPRECVVELSGDGKTYQRAARELGKDGECIILRFEPRRAAAVRLLFPSAYDTTPEDGRARNVQVREVRIAGAAGSLTAGSSRARPIKDLPLKSATRELGMSAPDCRFLLESAPGADGEPVVEPGEILDLTSRMDEDGTLRWKVPEGRWEVLRIGHAATGAHVSTQSAGWGGRVLDYLSPKALDHYWQRNVDPLLKAIGPLAGTTLKYVHTDSWEGGGMNWTPGFEKTFRDRRGYDPLPWLAVLAGHVVGSRDASNAFLADFRKTIGGLVAGHYGHLAELAARHGMGTHPECSGPHAGPLDGLKNYGRSSLVMSEFWSPSPHRPTPEARFFVKQAASAAHTYGKRLVGAEAFTTIGPQWNDVPWSDMKPSFDHEFCAGLNLVFNHTFTCSPAEMGIPGQEYFAGTHFNPQITWWDEAPVFIDYLKRCQFLAQQGTFVADVLHYYGDHVPNVFGNKAQDPAGALPGYDYDVLDEELLVSRLAVEDGRLALPSGMRYRVLSIPDHRVLSLAALKKIDALVRDGATVLGPKPLRAVSLEGGEEGRKLFHKLSDGLWGKGEAGKTGMREVGNGRVAWGKTAAEWLEADGVPPDVELKGTKDADWIHYRIGETDLYFLAHQEREGKEIEATFRMAGRVPELWNPADGSIREASRFQIADGRTRLPLTFRPFGSRFVVFRKPAGGNSRDAGPNQPLWREHQIIGGPWNVSFDPAWGGPKEPVTFDRLIDWTEHPDAAIRNYSGRAVYRTTFEIGGEMPAETAALELGDLRGVGIARVRLNGTDLGLVWRPPFRINLGRTLKPGINRLEVEVINSWHNRVMADAELPENQRLTRTNIRVGKKGRFAWKPEPSGLLGPVRVVLAPNGP